MSRTNTAAYESIKASQFTFQNPDRTFPEPGGVLMIDNFKGATTWSRNLDIKSLTLSGPSSVGVLTYDNQLLVNGSPVGGGGGLSGGYNISVVSGAINMDIQHDVSMNRNSIQDCSSITIVGQFGSPGTFRSNGTDIMLDKPFMVSSNPFGRLILKGTTTADQASLTFVEATKKLTIVSPTYEFKTSTLGGNIVEINSNIIAFSSDISMNKNIIGDCSGIILVDDICSGIIRYVDPNIQTSKSVQVYTPNPQIVFQDSTNNRAGAVSFAGGTETLNVSAKNIALISNTVGSIVIDNYGLTTSITNTRISNSIYSGSGTPLSANILTTDNTFSVGSIDISTNPSIVLQGGKGATLSEKKNSRIEYFDTSGVEQLRFTSKNYAFNAVPAAASALPTVLGYDTSSGEIKAQPATNGISALSAYTYDASGLLNVSGGVSLGAFAPAVSGVYGINFIITIANDGSTPIVFNNTQDSFELLVWNSIPPAPPPIKLTSIQNRPTTSIQTGIYANSIYQTLSSGISYTLIAGNENRSGTCSWASCVAEVRIIRLC
jgi:hypothetical protein